MRPLRRDLLSALAPPGRRGDGAGAAVERRLGPLDPSASASTWILSRALDRLDPAARRRVADGWRLHDRGRERTLVVDEGCDVRGLGPAADEARSALLAWLPPTRADLVLFEGGLCADDPLDALALLLRPPTIWPRERALTAARLQGGLQRFEPLRFERIERRAVPAVGSAELDRARAATRCLREQLPAHAGLSVARSTVEAGCLAVETSDARCAEVAARQLARYATSRIVGRHLRCSP